MIEKTDLNIHPITMTTMSLRTSKRFYTEMEDLYS